MKPQRQVRTTIKNALTAFLHLAHGLTVTEYAVAAGLIAASLTATFFALGTTIDSIILSIMAFM